MYVVIHGKFFMINNKILILIFCVSISFATSSLAECEQMPTSGSNVLLVPDSANPSQLRFCLGPSHGPTLTVTIPGEGAIASGAYCLHYKTIPNMLKITPTTGFSSPTSSVTFTATQGSINLQLLKNSTHSMNITNVYQPTSNVTVSLDLILIKNSCFTASSAPTASATE